jgi:hypothetical protein
MFNPFSKNCKVTDLEDEKPHVVSEVICVKCLYRWISVRQLKTLLKHLECPNCGQGYVIETGENVENI